MTLTHVILETSTWLDNKKSTIGFFVDLKKAFETVCHKIFLSKLHYYGISGIAQYWLLSYLVNKTQFMQINNEKSCISQTVC